MSSDHHTDSPGGQQAECRPQLTPIEEARFEGWIAGWDACLDHVWPLLLRAEHDADIWYVRANPGEMVRRMDAHFRAEEARFFGKDQT